MANQISANLTDIDNAEGRITIANRNFTKGGFANYATNHIDVLTANTVTYSIDGLLYTKAAVAQIVVSGLTFMDESGTTVSPITAQADGTTRVYLFVLNAAGTFLVVQRTGLIAASSSTICPGCPKGYAPIGALKVVNASGASFTLGTTAKNTAGITATYADVTLAPESM